MTNTGWRRARALFEAAVDRAPDERAAFVAAAAGEDGALRHEVESLLRSDASTNFLDRLPVAGQSMLADALSGPEVSVPTCQPVLTAGLRVGPYEILDPLGSGAMGEVYRASDTQLNRDVALKVLREHSALDRNRLTRFKREAQLLATLNHPNIAAIYGPGERHLISTAGGAANRRGVGMVGSCSMWNPRTPAGR